MAEKDDKDETITISKSQLEELLTKRERDAKMTDDEKKVRGMIREEITDVLKGFFDFGEGGEGGEDEREDNDGGSLGSLGKVLGLGGGKG